MKSLGTMGSLTPFIPTGRGVGLVEKRESVFSPLELSDSVSLVGDFNHSASSTLTLDYDVGGHLNHGEDPATHTLSLSIEASSVWDFNRGISQNVSITDHVHVSLDGVQIVEDSRHNLIAAETINVGQPVYISSSNTVNLADASSLNTSHVLGLAISDASANTTVIVLSEGKVERFDWTSIVGTANLVVGAVYYLDTTAGQMVTTPPTGDGDHVVRCGLAVNTTTLDIEVNEVAIL